MLVHVFDRGPRWSNPPGTFTVTSPDQSGQPTVIVLKGLSVIWLEDCVVLRVCCKKTNSSVNKYFSCLLYMLWLFGFKVWWWLAVELVGSQVEKMFIQDNGRDGGQTYGTVVWLPWETTKPLAIMPSTCNLNESNTSLPQNWKLIPASRYIPGKVFHVSTFINTAVFHFPQEMYERLHCSKDKYILLML